MGLTLYYGSIVVDCTKDSNCRGTQTTLGDLETGLETGSWLQYFELPIGVLTVVLIVRLVRLTVLALLEV